MSNVLIGIIGVILFIGLALAGALILGDDFRTSNADSKAAAIVSQIQQAQNAIDMYRLKTGQSAIHLGTLEWLQPRFLKALPVNPSAAAKANPGGYQFTFHVNNDTYVDTGDEGQTYNGAYVMTMIGADDNARQICQAIADIHTSGTILQSAWLPTQPVGCTRWTATEGYNYVAFGKI